MAEEILYIKANIDDINAKLDQLDKKLNKVADDAAKTGEELGDSQKKATKAVDNTTKAVEKQEGAVKKVGKQIGVFGKLVIAAFAAKAIEAVFKFGREITDLTAKMQQMDQKAKIVFGASLPLIEREARKAAAAIGLTKREFTAAAAGIADILVPLGFARSRSAALAAETTKLAGAIANWSGGNLEAAQASEILQKALVGETEQLKSVGIVVDQTSKQYGERVKVLMETEGLTMQQAKSIEILRQVQEQSLDAQKAYAEGAGMIAVEQAKTNAKLREAKEAFAEAITPATIKATSIYADIVQEISDLFTLADYGGSVLGQLAFAGDASVNVRKVRDELQLLTDEFVSSGQTFRKEFAFRDFNDLSAAIDKAAKSSKEFNDLSKDVQQELLRRAKIEAGIALERERLMQEQIELEKELSKEKQNQLELDEKRRLAARGILEVLEDQKKELNEQLKKSGSQEGINGILEKREGIERRINFILSQRQILIDFENDNSENKLLDPQPYFKFEGDKVEAAREANKKREDLADELYEAEIARQQEVMQAKMKNDKDYADWLASLNQQQADATVAAASFAFGQLKTLYAEDAEAQKVFAIFDALISAYQAINAALTVPPPAGQILAATIGALAFANVAKIASEPVPSYFEGTDSLKRGNNPRGRDTIPVMAHEGEAIIPTRRNLEAPGLASAWIKGDLDRYINVNHVLPAIAKIKQDKRIQELKLTGGGPSSFNDERLLRQLKKNNKSTEAMIEFLATRRANYNPYRL